MEETRKSISFVFLIAGLLLLWGGYFAVRANQVARSETAEAEVRALSWGHFSLDVPHRRGVFLGEDNAYDGRYLRPVIHFFYKAATADRGRWYIVRPECMGFVECEVGDRPRVIFPQGQPEAAEIYTLGDFWFPAGYTVILLSVSFIGTIIFLAVKFKPWIR